MPWNIPLTHISRCRWYKFIEGTTRKQAVVLNDRVKQVSGTLIIKDAVVEDSGKYLCVVNNSVGGESVETVLTVTAPLSAKIDPPTQTIDFGRPAVFTCQYTGNPIKTVSWMKDGKAMGHSEPVLRIESVKKEDKGMYQCFVRNDQESAEASAELKLGGRFDPPVIRQAFQEETMEPGPSVFLKCVAGGNPTPEISWELDGKKIANNDRFQVGQYVTVNGDVVSYLNITSVHANDGGLYKCIAKSKVGVAEHSAKLNVYGLPYIRQMEKKAIVAGETLMVTCPVAGYPIDSIVWERGKRQARKVRKWQDFMYFRIHLDNRALPINRKQKVFPNGTLIIENVERNSDQATYTCVAKNQEGYSARGSLEVQVMGKSNCSVTASAPVHMDSSAPVFTFWAGPLYSFSVGRSLHSIDNVTSPTDLSATTDRALWLWWGDHQYERNGLGHLHDQQGWHPTRGVLDHSAGTQTRRSASHVQRWHLDNEDHPAH